jgi:hypothetical protein
MFVDRKREDRVFAAMRPGIFDGIATRFRDRRWLRELADAAERLLSPGKSLYCKLGQGKYLALAGARRCRVRCERGALWVTASGNGRDMVLTPGQSVTLARAGKVVVSGRGEASEATVRWD